MEKIAQEFLSDLRGLKAKQSWQRFKKVKVEAAVLIVAYHGWIPRELRHPDEYGYDSEEDVPGYDDYDRWEGDIDRVISATEKKYPHLRGKLTTASA